MSQPPPPPPFPPSPSPQWPTPGSGSTGKTSRPLLWFTAAAVTLAVIVVVALVVVLLTRDDDGNDGANERPTDASSQPSDPATTDPATTDPTTTPTQAGPDNSAVVGEWYGRYRCTQGASAGRLSIEAVPGSSTQVTAVFRFGESRINDDVGPGSYRMTGEVTDSQITLTAGEWIKQAPGYTTVDLTAPVTTNAPTELFGDVLSPGCQRFRFLRQ